MKFEIRTTSKRRCAQCDCYLNHNDDRVEIKKLKWEGRLTTHIEKDYCFPCAINKGLIDDGKPQKSKN